MSDCRSGDREPTDLDVRLRIETAASQPIAEPEIVVRRAGKGHRLAAQIAGLLIPESTRTMKLTGGFCPLYASDTLDVDARNSPRKAFPKG